MVVFGRKVTQSHTYPTSSQLSVLAIEADNIAGEITLEHPLLPSCRSDLPCCLLQWLDGPVCDICVIVSLFLQTPPVGTAGYSMEYICERDKSQAWLLMEQGLNVGIFLLSAFQVDG